MTFSARWPRIARALVKRFPDVESGALRALDWPLRLVLLPFRRPRRQGTCKQAPDLEGQVDAFNAAAENYFAEFSDQDYLLDKPYSEGPHFSRHLINAGVLIGALQIQPGSRVLEFGAGSCWLSHMLNRHGCHTTAVDVSGTAVSIGRRLFEADSRVRWDLDPQFVSYDGYTLPLKDGSFDFVVVHDAFHHVPNQSRVLSELARVLTADGVVGMSEPGLGHSGTEQSASEMSTTGVLENELCLEDIRELALQAGFQRTAVVVADPGLFYEVEVSDLPRFMGGGGFASYWKRMTGALERHHYIVLHKEWPRSHTTRYPGVLSVAIEWRDGAIRVDRGHEAVLSVSVRNTGDTRWLADEGLGWTRLGMQLSKKPGRSVDRDWLRVPLPHDVEPGAVFALEARIVAPSDAGEYDVSADMVVEGVGWFSELGTRSAQRLKLIVE